MTPISITSAVANNGSNVWTVTLPALPTASQSIEVSLTAFNNTGAPTLTISDSHGNTGWSVQTHVGDSSSQGANWRKYQAMLPAPSLSSGSPFVITITGSKDWGIFVGSASVWPAILTRVSGLSTAGVSVSSAASAQTITNGPAALPAIAVSVLAVEAGDAGIAAPSGWTLGKVYQQWSGGPTPFGMAYRDVPSTGSLTTTWTFNSSDQAGAQTSVYSYSGGGGGGGSFWECPAAPTRTNTRWIDPTGGSDSNNGLTKATAWKRLGNHALGTADPIPANCTIKFVDGTHSNAGMQYHGGIEAGLPTGLTITSESFRGSILSTTSDGDFLIFVGHSFSDIVIHGIRAQETGDDYGNGWITWGGDCNGISVIGCKGFNLGRTKADGSDNRQDHATYIYSGTTYAAAPRNGRIAYNEFSGNRNNLGCALTHSYASGGGYLFHDYEIDHNIATGNGFAWAMLLSGGYASGSNANLNIHDNDFRLTFQTGVAATLAMIRFYTSTGGAPNSGVDSTCAVTNNVMAVLGGTAHIIARDSVSGTAHNPTINNNIVYQGGGAALTSNWTLAASNTVVSSLGDLPAAPTITAPGGAGPTGTHTSTVASGSTVTVTFSVSATTPSAVVTLTRSAGSVLMPATFSGATGTATFTNVDAGTWTSSIVVTDAYGTVTIPGTVTTIVGISGTVTLQHTALVTSINASPNVLNRTIGAPPAAISVVDQSGIPLPGVVLSSSAASVATVTSPSASTGQASVTFNGAGSATITATYSDPTNGLISTTIAVVVAGAVPVAPSNLIATAGVDFIDLVWSDQSNNETGFSIRRSPTENGTYVEIGTVGQNAVSYRDAGITPGERWYQVAAVNSVGASIPSNKASATVVPAPGLGGIFTPGIRIGGWVGSVAEVKVQVLNGSGTPISGRTVNASSSAPSATVAASAVTGADGRAKFNVTLASGGVSIITFTDSVTSETAQMRVVSRGG